MMTNHQKGISEIIAKLGIEKLNAMQDSAMEVIRAGNDIILLSPTGSGKTLAYLLPVTMSLDPSIQSVQALVIVPTRELAIQIESVARNMGAGNKINAVYGGRSSAKDRLELSHAPAILIGTPGQAVLSPSKDKLATLYNCIRHVGNQPTIVFCNFKDSIQRISEYLADRGVAHGCFHGGLEQRDRERALIKFRNGTHQIIVATDLAARGIDVPEIKYIIHYHLPIKEEEFIHRNGRTARMNRSGNSIVLRYEREDLPEYIGPIETLPLNKKNILKPTLWRTIFISGGRKDKISKGDIAGKFFKVGKLEKDELGLIELKTDCVFVSVKAEKVAHIVNTFNNTRIKKKKVRVFQV